MQNKIILFNLQAQAYELKAQNLSYRAIAESLSRESGKNISRQNVFNFFRSHPPSIPPAVREEMEKKVPELKLAHIGDFVLDVTSELKSANEHAHEQYLLAKANGDIRAALLAIERREKQLELQANLLADSRKVSTSITINFLEPDAHEESLH